METTTEQYRFELLAERFGKTVARLEAEMATLQTNLEIVKQQLQEEKNANSRRDDGTNSG